MKEVIDRAEVKIAITEVQGRNIKQILQPERNSPLYLHILENHEDEGDIDDFIMCVTGVYSNYIV